MGEFCLIMGLCLFVSVFAARVATALRKGKSRRHDEEVQDAINKWRAEHWGWRRKAGNVEEKEGQAGQELSDQ